MMKLAEIRELTDVEINQQIDQWRNKLTEMRCDSAVGSLADNSEIKKTKRKIAQAYTVIKELQFSGKEG